MKSGIELIAEERQEQITKHGFCKEHDKDYIKKELIQAANYCLMLAGFKGFFGRNIFWPDGWNIKFEHKIIAKSTVGKLVVAGAFLMAENDRRCDSFYSEFIEEIAGEIDKLIKF